MTVRKTEDGDGILRRRSGEQGDERPAVSYLVRFWLEPREGEGADAPYRGYARDLRTGEERYFQDPRRLAEHILRRLHAERREDVHRDTEESEQATG